MWKLEEYGHVEACHHPDYGRRVTGFLETLVASDGGRTARPRLGL